MPGFYQFQKKCTSVCTVTHTVVVLCIESNDLFDVNAELMPVVARWKYIGLALRLDPDKLDEIEADNRNVEESLTNVLKLWLKKSYNAKKFGEPSWCMSTG